MDVHAIPPFTHWRWQPEATQLWSSLDLAVQGFLQISTSSVSFPGPSRHFSRYTIVNVKYVLAKLGKKEYDDLSLFTTQIYFVEDIQRVSLKRHLFVFLKGNIGGGGMPYNIWGFGILVLQPRIEPTPPTVKGWSLNHWTTREVLTQKVF